MTILVLGGSSQIGHFLLPRLQARGEAVLALSRHRQSDLPGVQWREGQLPDAVPPLPPLSAIISFGPLLALAQWLASVAPTQSPPGIATFVEPLARGGSLVLVAHADPARLEATYAAERATARFPAQPARS